MSGLVCPTGRANRHHPDATLRFCIGCKRRIVDTLRGWITKAGA